MAKHWPAVGGALVVLAAVGVLADVRWGTAQPGIRDGAFVVAQDGSRWVVGNGTRYRIDWTVDDTNAIATLPEGASVATVCEAAAAVAGMDAAAACAGPAPPTAPAQASTILLDVVLEVGGRTTDIRSMETFTLTTEQRLEMCWELLEPTTAPRSYANILLTRYRPGADHDDVGMQEAAATADGCKGPLLFGPDTYRVAAQGNYRRIRVIVRVV